VKHGDGSVGGRGRRRVVIVERVGGFQGKGLDEREHGFEPKSGTRAEEGLAGVVDAR